MKVFLQTFGCQMNKLDSAIVESSLKNAGYEFVNKPEDSNIVLINTCSVRDHAEQRVMSHLGHLNYLKKSNRELIVGVIGCMAQRLGNELLNHPAVDIVCGPAQISQIPLLITQRVREKRKSLAVASKIREISQDAQSLEKYESEYGFTTELPSQAYVRAMHGCDKFCSYCVVPYVRGPETSRPPESIIEQSKHLADKGIKQITLLGQRINAYEYKAGDKTYCLADLLEMISQIEGIEWIKFVTSYPSKKYFKEIMQAMTNVSKICRYLHIPAQSGSDKILNAMNRGYTCAEYLEFIDMARQIVPDIAIAGDFIVGFPGETDEDFNETIELLKKSKYKNSFIFKYSPRPQTIADKRLEDNIPQEIKQKRNYELLKIQEEISMKVASEFIGRTVKVLVEGRSKKSHQAGFPTQLVGRTAGDWIVIFNGPENLDGQFTNVKIARTTPLTLFGDLM